MEVEVSVKFEFIDFLDTKSKTNTKKMSKNRYIFYIVTLITWRYGYSFYSHTNKKQKNIDRTVSEEFAHNHCDKRLKTVNQNVLQIIRKK